MTNPVRDAVYTVTVPADLSAAVLAACRAEAAAGIKRAPTPMMRVLPPVTAAAACAAVLGVALYLGGNTPDDLPVLPPVGNESTTTTEVTEPTADTITTTAKPTTKTEPTKTAATTVKEKPIVFADEPLNEIPEEELSIYSDNCFGSLRRKMELYKGQDVMYAVVIEVPIFYEDMLALHPLSKFESEEDWIEYANGYLGPIHDQRMEKLKEIIGEELIPVSSTDGKYRGVYATDKNTFIMDLTAEEINKLDECGCFFIRLRHPDGDKEVDFPE